MKAKEYQVLYYKLQLEKMSKIDTVVSILIKFKEELFELIDKRKCKGDSAILAIIRELNQKWLAFCNLINDPEINKGQFMLTIKALMPKLYHMLPLNMRAEYV